MKRSNNVWRCWAKALGEKASKCNQESDRIALIRTIIFITYLTTNLFIIAGVIRHWNSDIMMETKNEVSGDLPQTKKE